MRFIIVLLIAGACFGQGKQNVVQTGIVDAHGASWIFPSATFASPPSAPLTAQTWDTSGNGMLNGKYYFRHVLYQLSNAGTGALYDEVSLYGTVTFNGTTPGTYTISATEVDV